MRKHIGLLFAAVLLLGVLGGCSKQTTGLKDGYYSAEMSAFSRGWKEFLTMDVSNGKIVAVEFNAKNESGLIKAWDMAYMRTMNGVKGTYPNRYTRTYAENFIETQGAQEVDMVSGASSSGGNFRAMAAALLAQAKTGDTSPIVVEAPPES